MAGVNDGSGLSHSCISYSNALYGVCPGVLGRCVQIYLLQHWLGAIYRYPSTVATVMISGAGSAYTTTAKVAINPRQICRWLIASAAGLSLLCGSDQFCWRKIISPALFQEVPR